MAFPMHREISHTDSALRQDSNLPLYVMTALIGALIGLNLLPRLASYLGVSALAGPSASAPIASLSSPPSWAGRASFTHPCKVCSKDASAPTWPWRSPGRLLAGPRSLNNSQLRLPKKPSISGFSLHCELIVRQ
jgi:hypothetical protein